MARSIQPDPVHPDAVTDVHQLVADFRGSASVRRKAPLPEVISTLRVPLHESVVTWEGEDAAVLDLGGDDLILLAMDSIMDGLVEADPRFAGHAAVAVNVNDIVAMGGRPIAAVDLIGSGSDDQLRQILQGLREGALKYNLGIVGGHLAAESASGHVAVAVMGSVPRDGLMRTDGARAGDTLLLAYEEQGVAVAGLAWHSGVHLSRELLQIRHDAIRAVAPQVNACKDVSNGGVLISSSAMAEASRCGAEILLDGITPPASEAVPAWVTYHLGCGFLFSVAAGNLSAVRDRLHEGGLATNEVGRMVEGSRIICRWQNEEAVLFDWALEPIILPTPAAIRSVPAPDSS